MYIVRVLLMSEAGCYESYIVDKFDNKEQAEEAASQMTYENGCYYWVEREF